MTQAGMLALGALAMLFAGGAEAAARKRAGKAAVVGVLNVNRASEAELRLLPGVGKTRAQAIVARRSQRPFESVDDLARMKGFSGLARKLRAHLGVSGDSTLRPAPPGKDRRPGEAGPPTVH